MKFVRRALIVLAVLAGGFMLVLFNHEGLQDRVVRNAVNNTVASQPADTFGRDGIDVVFCGTASPMGGGDRAQQCIAVFAGSHFFIVDAGARSASVAAALGLPLARLDGVMLTHFHSDHIAALGELHLASWARGRPSKLDVYGGPGVARITGGFNTAYGQDYVYRTEHHGVDFMPPENAGLVTREIAMPQSGRAVIFEDDGLTVSAFTVSHDPVHPAYGIRFDYRGRSVVVSGDTSKDPNVARVAKDSDVLIHEVLQPELVNMLADALAANGAPKIGKILRDTLTYHTTPVEAAEIAVDAGAEMLVFTHFAPVPQNRLMKRYYLRGVEAVRPSGAVLAHDGMHIHVPFAGGAPFVK